MFSFVLFSEVILRVALGCPLLRGNFSVPLFGVSTIRGSLLSLTIFPLPSPLSPIFPLPSLLSRLPPPLTPLSRLPPPLTPPPTFPLPSPLLPPSPSPHPSSHLPPPLTPPPTFPLPSPLLPPSPSPHPSSHLPPPLTPPPTFPLPSPLLPPSPSPHPSSHLPPPLTPPPTFPLPSPLLPPSPSPHPSSHLPPHPVSQPQHLMPAVLSGDLTRVHSVISHLANNLSNQSRESPQFHQSTKTATIGESSTSLETHQPLTKSPDQGSKKPRPHEQPLAPPAKRSRISTETIVADSAVLASKPVYATLSSADMTSIDFDAELPVLSTEAVVRGVSKGWGLEVLNEKTDQNCTILHVCGRIDHTHSSKGKGQNKPHLLCLHDSYCILSL